MPIIRINPQSQAAVAITVKREGTLRNDALITADVFLPTGQLVAASQQAFFVASGEYTMPIDPEWSTAVDGSAISGVFKAIGKVDLIGEIKHFRVRWLCEFVDDEDQ